MADEKKLKKFAVKAKESLGLKNPKVKEGVVQEVQPGIFCFLGFGPDYGYKESFGKTTAERLFKDLKCDEKSLTNLAEGKDKDIELLNKTIEGLGAENKELKTANSELQEGAKETLNENEELKKTVGKLNETIDGLKVELEAAKKPVK